MKKILILLLFLLIPLTSGLFTSDIPDESIGQYDTVSINLSNYANNFSGSYINFINPDTLGFVSILPGDIYYTSYFNINFDSDFIITLTSYNKLLTNHSFNVFLTQGGTPLDMDSFYLTIDTVFIEQGSFCTNFNFSGISYNETSLSSTNFLGVAFEPSNFTNGNNTILYIKNVTVYNAVSEGDLLIISGNQTVFINNSLSGTNTNYYYENYTQEHFIGNVISFSTPIYINPQTPFFVMSNGTGGMRSGLLNSLGGGNTNNNINWYGGVLNGVSSVSVSNNTAQYAFNVYSNIEQICFVTGNLSVPTNPPIIENDYPDVLLGYNQGLADDVETYFNDWNYVCAGTFESGANAICVTKGTNSTNYISNTYYNVSLEGGNNNVYLRLTSKNSDYSTIVYVTAFNDVGSTSQQFYFNISKTADNPASNFNEAVSSGGVADIFSSIIGLIGSFFPDVDDLSLTSRLILTILVLCLTFGLILYFGKNNIIISSIIALVVIFVEVIFFISIGYIPVFMLIIFLIIIVLGYILKIFIGK